MKRAILTIIAAAALAGPALGAERLVASADALGAAIGAARGGDVILIAPGRYGALRIEGRRFADAVTLRAADPGQPPEFSAIVIARTAHVVLDGMIVAYGASAAPSREAAVHVAHAEQVVLRNLAISSAPNGVAGDDAQGVRILTSRGVTLTDCRIEETFRGVIAFENDDVAIRRTVILGSGSDGIAARGADGMVIEDNYIGDFLPVDAQALHPDGVQLWSKSAARANRNVVIRRNVIRRGDGAPAQGIFARTPEIATEGLLIEENIIDQSMGQGIFVQNAVGVTIRGNALSAVAPFLHAPAIEVRAPFGNALVERNAAPKYRLPPGVDARANDAVRQ
jgi:nitrous oxidase accessory protein NosD